LTASVKESKLIFHINS